MQVEIAPDKPWSDWHQPDIYNRELHELSVMNLDDQLVLAATDGEGGEVEVIGELTEDFYQQLGWKVGFPGDFVGSKLSKDVQAVVINERIRQTKNAEFTLIAEESKVTNLTAGWRGIIPYAETAQFVHDSLREVYGDMLEIDHARANGKMQCRILVPGVNRPITPKVNDILQLGIIVDQCYGTNTEVALYTRRLACLNGMQANRDEFKWTQKSAGSVEHQFSFLQQGIANALGAYERLIEQSRLMAATSIDGNPHEILREYGRAAGVPTRHINELISAYEVEPGGTMWDIVNAMTRLATHGSLSRRVARNLQLTAGEWVNDFEMVTARLPRPMAVKIGAQVIEGDEA